MNRIEVLLTEPVGTIDPNIYGHFIEHLGACVYDGLWVGDQQAIAHTGGLCDEVVAALKRIGPSVIRWPGGCFADDYHWRDGIGPTLDRPRRVNIHWGEVVETNAFGTHEFMQLCRALGAQPYLCGNVGSGSPQEMRDWVEYCNFPAGSTLSDLRARNGSPEPFGVRYWAVGNENWGCGGQFTPEDYGAEYRRFCTYLRDLGGTRLHLIACGPDGNDVEWTRRFFQKLAGDYRDCRRIHGYSAHYYCGTSGTATEYTDAQWYHLLAKAQRMQDLVRQQRAAMDVFDPERRIGLVVDEWGAWHPPTPGRNPMFLWQQNTLRDALVAALTLDIFNRHADIVAMANIAQMVNVLQAPVLTGKGAPLLTPTYHVYDLYRGHQGGQSVRVLCESPEIRFMHGNREWRLASLAASASLRQRTLTLTVVNPHVAAPVEAQVNLRGEASAAIVRETTLTATDIHAHNTFEQPAAVAPTAPRVLSLSGQSLAYTFGPGSVTRLEMSLV